MTYVIINTIYGGFRLSEKALSEYRRRTGLNSEDWEITRDSEELVAIVREMGEDANGSFAELKIVEVPSGVEWQIEEYDGAEWVAEKHRTWR